MDGWMDGWMDIYMCIYIYIYVSSVAVYPCRCACLSVLLSPYVFVCMCSDFPSLHTYA